LSGKEVDLAETAGKVIESAFLEKKEYVISEEVKHLELYYAGVVILKKGEANTVSYKYLPKKESSILCEKSRSGDRVMLGMRESAGSSYNTVFNVTYKDFLPNIKVSGSGMVRVMGESQGKSVVLELSDESKCVIESLSTDVFTLKQSDASQCLVNKLVATDVSAVVSGSAQANLMGLVVSNKITANVHGMLTEGESQQLLRLDGKAKLLDVTTAQHGRLDALNCSATTVYLAVHPQSLLTEVHVKEYLLVKPFAKIRHKMYTTPDVTAKIEYAGVPRRIQTQCDVSLAPSRTSSVLSWVTGKIGDKFGIRVDPSEVTELISSKITEKVGQKLGISPQ
jgi:hypothetical protein